MLDDESDFKLAHDSTFDAFVAALTAAETKLEEKDEARAEKPAAEKKNEREALEPRLPKMLATTKHVRMVFDELLVKEVAKHEEAVKKRKRTEERYMDLLEVRAFGEKIYLLGRGWLNEDSLILFPFLCRTTTIAVTTLMFHGRMPSTRCGGAPLSWT